VQLYGHIIGIYRRSGERGGRWGGEGGKRKGKEGEKGSVRKPGRVRMVCRWWPRMGTGRER